MTIAICKIVEVQAATGNKLHLKPLPTPEEEAKANKLRKPMPKVNPIPEVKTKPVIQLGANELEKEAAPIAL
jgi:hypothetical protein